MVSEVLHPRIRQSVFERDDFICQYCGKRPECGSDLEIDHVVPVSRGGSSGVSNLVTACRSCNRKKGVKLPEELSIELISVSFRMRQSVADRLETAKWTLKMPKVQVVEKALEELYEKYNIPEPEESPG